jgi:hypothetical protein
MPVLEQSETRGLLDSIDMSKPVGLRDQALLLPSNPNLDPPARSLPRLYVDGGLGRAAIRSTLHGQRDGGRGLMTKMMPVLAVINSSGATRKCEA